MFIVTCLTVTLIFPVACGTIARVDRIDYQFNNEVKSMATSSVAILAADDLRVTGSGVMLKHEVGQRILVLTARHVTDHLNNVMAIMYITSNGEKRTVSAHTMKASDNFDLALVISDSLAEETDSFATLAGAEPRVGDVLYVVGCPNGRIFNVSKGILSNVFFDTDDGVKHRYYRTDAAIYFGNSGGPAYNDRGQIVGIADMVEGAGAGRAVVPGSGILITVVDIKKFIYNK